MNAAEIRYHVRRDITFRIAHFIQKLLFDRRDIYPSAGAGMFGNDKFSVRRRLDDGKTDVGHIRYTLPFILAISARALRAAFDDVPGDGTGGNLVPVVKSPAEFMHQGR